jgi:THO complex subunit 4
VVFISNLLTNVDENDLREIFSSVGKLTKATIHYDKNGRSHGTADATFSRPQEAEQAVKEYDAAEVDGKPMYLRLALTREVLSTLSRRPPRPAPKCFNCGKDGHRAADCTEPKKETPAGAEGEEKNVCFQCGKPGHRARQCPEGGGERGGRGGRRGGKRGKPAVGADDLDAEMDEYFSKKSATEEGADGKTLILI